MRELSSLERKQVKALSQRAIDFALIEPTETGLRKCILDATGPVRTFLASENLHDFDSQKQGQEHKIILRANLITASRRISSDASLYRPVTKKGDPRIWFTNLREICQPNDVLAIVALDGNLCLLNMSRCNVADLADRNDGPVGELVNALQSSTNAVSAELLLRLRALAQAGPIESVMPEYADTAVGRTIEHVLGIAMNSRNEPDYHGIELKSSRIRTSGNKHTLFAKVPDWSVSHLSSTSEILDNFGYETERDFRLYCTVSARSPNPQSLFLKLDRSRALLEEMSSIRSKRRVVAWKLETLQKALSEKHAETFWISVSSDRSGEREQFQIRSVEHTRAPIMSQFELLLEQGHITVDHLIKRTKVGRVSEGGPLFKISRKAFPLLFPPSRKYELA